MIGSDSRISNFQLFLLQLQEEFDDEDDWVPSKAAGVCLMLLAQCCENDVVSPVLAFVQANFQSADWKERDAAIMAFGKWHSNIEL